MKKDKYRFNIRFNPEDPRQRQAAEMLNAVSPRGKAVLVTNALLADQSRGDAVPLIERPSDPQDVEADAGMAEAIGSAMDMFMKG